MRQSTKKNTRKNNQYQQKTYNTLIEQLPAATVRTIVIFPELLPVCGNRFSCLIFLCQLGYWSVVDADEDRWVRKSQLDWHIYTRLNPRTQYNARKLLVTLGIIEEEYYGIPRKLAYRINEEILKKAWESWLPNFAIYQKIYEINEFKKRHNGMLSKKMQKELANLIILLKKKQKEWRDKCPLGIFMDIHKTLQINEFCEDDDTVPDIKPEEEIDLTEEFDDSFVQQMIDDIDHLSDSLSDRCIETYTDHPEQEVDSRIIPVSSGQIRETLTPEVAETKVESSTKIINKNNMDIKHPQISLEDLKNLLEKIEDEGGGYYEFKNSKEMEGNKIFPWQFKRSRNSINPDFVKFCISKLKAEGGSYFKDCDENNKNIAIAWISKAGKSGDVDFERLHRVIDYYESFLAASEQIKQAEKVKEVPQMTFREKVLLYRMNTAIDVITGKLNPTFITLPEEKKDVKRMMDAYNDVKNNLTDISEVPEEIRPFISRMLESQLLNK